MSEGSEEHVETDFGPDDIERTVSNIMGAIRSGEDFVLEYDQSMSQGFIDELSAILKLSGVEIIFPRSN